MQIKYDLEYQISNNHTCGSETRIMELMPTQTILTERYKEITWQNARDILLLNPTNQVFFECNGNIAKVFFMRKWKGELKLFLNHQSNKIIHVSLETKFYIKK